MLIKKILPYFIFFTPLTLLANEWSGNIDFQGRYFTKAALSPSQFNQTSSVSLKAEWFHEWDRGRQSITFSPFIRVDQNDDKRTHSDIRELSWLIIFDESELRAGIQKVFWGVTESQHLVDIINQTDLVENLDGEKKLGQPMINFSMIKDWGTVDIFLLPFFRQRTFPGVNGRLRTFLPIDTSNPIYESSDKENNVDQAIRWSHSLGIWDIGLSYFKGTSRAPSFVVTSDLKNLRPVYNQLQQFGIDVQATKESWLWKMEAVDRKIKTGNYTAATIGFEYTFNAVFDSRADIGIVTEYLYDDRRSNATTPFENDLMLGLRWVKNDESDTNLLVGAIADLDDDEIFFSLEGSRRIAENWKINIEARIFKGLTDSTNPLYFLRKDDFIQVDVAYYF